MSMIKRCAAALLALLLLLALPAPALAAGRREAVEDAPPVTEIGTAAALICAREGSSTISAMTPETSAAVTNWIVDRRTGSAFFVK